MSAIYRNGIWYGVNAGSGDPFQVKSLPAATSALVGVIYQYVGVTGQDYTHGYFYECVEDSSVTPPTYSWENILVQNGGSGSGHTIIDGSGNTLTNRTGLQFIGATVTDDVQNDKTVVTVLQQMNYSTSEQVVGTWIDGKLVYQKTNIIYIMDKNLEESNTSERTLFEYTFDISTTVTLLDMIGKTTTSSNQGYINIYLNSELLSQTYLISNTNTDLTDITFTTSIGDVLSIKTGWDNSHTQCYWEFIGKMIKYPLPSDTDIIIKQDTTSALTITENENEYTFEYNTCQYTKTTD